MNMVNDLYESTISYRITRQCIDHMYGPERALDEESFHVIGTVFANMGGSWEAVVRGAPSALDVLKDVIESYFEVVDNPEEYGISDE